MARTAETAFVDGTLIGTLHEMPSLPLLLPLRGVYDMSKWDFGKSLVMINKVPPLSNDL